MKKPIYQMSYDEFKKMCWDRWGILISCGFISDAVTGRIKDHRESEITVKMPSINYSANGDEEPLVDFKNTTVVKFRRLRDAIGYVSKKQKKPVTRNYFDFMERYMAKLREEYK